MGNNSVAPGGPLSLQSVLDALDDGDCRTILRNTADPMTAAELLDSCDIPKSTLYRKLELLAETSLIRERETVNPTGGRTTRYERDFENVVITIDADDTFSVAVERPNRKADERLEDIWSEMRDGT